jgi:hypothetical protein
MEQTECSETSAYKLQTPGNHPKESIQHLEYGKSLKSTNALCSLQNLPFPNRVKCRTEGKKVIAQEIEWLPTDDIPFGAVKVVEIFSIVTVEVRFATVCNPNNRPCIV